MYVVTLRQYGIRLTWYVIVTQSSFESPCSPLIGAEGYTPSGFDSGFHPTPKTISLNINTTDPLWFYCRQTDHCRKGMVFAVNPSTHGDHTFAAFQARAIASAPPRDPPGTGYLTPIRKIVDVVVGANGTLAYDPPFVDASAGDEIRFNFVAKNHTATQSSFDQPCTSQIGPDGVSITGFDTGFNFVANGSAPVKQSFIMPQTDKPLWFYCRQTGHCAKGMVFAVNAPKHGDHTFDAFRKKATNTGGGDVNNGTRIGSTPLGDALESTSNGKGDSDDVKSPKVSRRHLVAALAIVGGVLVVFVMVIAVVCFPSRKQRNRYTPTLLQEEHNDRRAVYTHPVKVEADRFTVPEGGTDSMESLNGHVGEPGEDATSRTFRSLPSKGYRGPYDFL